MTGQEYQNLAMRTNDGQCGSRLKSKVGKPDVTVYEHGLALNESELICGALGLSGEAGEVADIVKKHIFHGHDFKHTELIHELGDVLWYIVLCCNALNISLDEVMSLNIEKLKRRYPNGFSADASINREEYLNV